MSPVVHVACKLPSGLQVGEVRIRGSAYDRDPDVQAPELIGGYAITLNVPEDTWSEWAATNSRSRMLTHDMVFAEPDLATLKAKASSMAHVRTGLEPR